MTYWDLELFVTRMMKCCHALMMILELLICRKERITMMVIEVYMSIINWITDIILLKSK